MARERLLQRLRDALGPHPQVPLIPREYRTHGDLDPVKAVERFQARLDDYHAEFISTKPTAVSSSIARILRTAAVRTLVVPAGLPGEWLDALDHDVDVVRDVGGCLSVDALDRADAVLTGSSVAIADTGTIVLDGSPDQGRRALSLVPDRHLCVVRADNIVTTVPEAMRRIDATRPLTFVSGPSATSDIELDRVEGVHGPRNLHVIMETESVPHGNTNPAEPSIRDGELASEARDGKMPPEF